MPLEKGHSEGAFKHNVKAEMHAGKPQRQALAIAYAVKRKKKMAAGGQVIDSDDPQDMHQERYPEGTDLSPELKNLKSNLQGIDEFVGSQVPNKAHGGLIQNEKLHPEHEPMGMRPGLGAHDIAHMIMRRKMAQPPEEYLADGGMSGPSEQDQTAPDAAEQAIMDNQALDARVQARMNQRQSMKQGQVYSDAYAKSQRQATQGPSGIDNDERINARAAERQQEDEQMHSRVNKAYGGQIEPQHAKEDFLALAGHDDMDDTTEGEEAPHQKRRKMLDGIMRDLHGAHYGK